MKFLKFTTILACFTYFLLSSCEENTTVNFMNPLDDIASDTYYENDILAASFPTINGTWEVSSTSGGFIGDGYDQDFDELIIKPNAIFGLIRNDSLIAYGKLEMLEEEGLLYIDFIPDTDSDDTQIQILLDNRKFFILEEDSLNLKAPCCDRFNTHLVRGEK